MQNGAMGEEKPQKPEEDASFDLPPPQESPNLGSSTKVILPMKECVCEQHDHSLGYADNEETGVADQGEDKGGQP